MSSLVVGCSRVFVRSFWLRDSNSKDSVDPFNFMYASSLALYASDCAFTSTSTSAKSCDA